MIVELVDKLIDRSIQLIKHHQETRRNLLEDFVNPVFSEFESVHENYLECFQKYRDIIKSSDNPRSVIHEIEKDHLFTEGQRRKLIELSDFSEEPMVGGFVDAIGSYLIGKYYYIFGFENKYTNWPRRGLLQGLKNVYSSYTGNPEPQEIQRKMTEAVQQFKIERIRKTDNALNQKGRNIFDAETNYETASALYMLDSLVEEMQSRYIIVTSEYIKLKKKLLM